MDNNDFESDFLKKDAKRTRLGINCGLIDMACALAAFTLVAASVCDDNTMANEQSISLDLNKDNSRKDEINKLKKKLKKKREYLSNYKENSFSEKEKVKILK